MKKINPLELFLWTFRRNEKDVVNLYNALSDVMKFATGGDMLNFGYWDDNTKTPIDAQKKMCTIFGKKSILNSNLRILDIGSGTGSPAIHWFCEYPKIEISCININFPQLLASINNVNNTTSVNNLQNFNFVNATATTLPFYNDSMDRILSLEAAQHFKPLKNFFSESYRILRKDGILTLAIPAMAESKPTITNLGSLFFTWSSEHYTIDYILSGLKQEGFQSIDVQKIGSNVYEPLADFYIDNRNSIKNKILEYYPSYIEKILFNSIKKMKKVSEKKIIDYLIISCIKK